MPTYEYQCPQCGYHFEKFQSMKDERLTQCPKCRKSGLKRLVGGGAGLIFKGSGFYITDYKRGAAKKQEGAEAKAASPAAESKPAAKPAPKTET